ncbi:uncharacterized [Tachysurus ichikawai]
MEQALPARHICLAPTEQVTRCPRLPLSVRPLSITPLLLVCEQRLLCFSTLPDPLQACPLSSVPQYEEAPWLGFCSGPAKHDNER